MKNFKILLIMITICAWVLFFLLKPLKASEIHFPMDIAAKVTDTSQLPEGPVIVTVTISVQTYAPNYLKSAKVQAGLISGNSSIEPKEINISDITSDSPKTVEFKVKPALGNTEIEFKVPASDSSGGYLFYAVTMLCLVWDGNELLSGGSITHAKMDKIKKDYAEGRITKDKFDCEFQRIITGGDTIKNMDCSKILKMLEVDRKHQDDLQK